MTTKDKIITISITIIVILALIFTGFHNRLNDTSRMVYQVYLDGQKLGLISNDQELLNMIDEEQSDIKNTYGVVNVYPPNGFEIEKYKTYNENITPAAEIYNKIKDNGNFTIKGYTITITKEATEEKEEEKIYLSVLDQQVFKDALEKVITAFVNKED